MAIKSSSRGGKRTGSGRKPGIKNKVTIDLRKIAQPYSKEAIGVLVEIMRDTEAPAATRVQAVDKLLDRGHGKAPVAIEVDTAIDLNVTSLEFLQENFIKVMDKARERERAMRIDRGITLEGDFKETDKQGVEK